MEYIKIRKDNFEWEVVPELSDAVKNGSLNVDLIRAGRKIHAGKIKTRYFFEFFGTKYNAKEYANSFFRTSRAKREFETVLRVAKLGVKVKMPVIHIECRDYGIVAYEFLEDWVPASEYLAQKDLPPAKRIKVIVELARFFRNVLEAGVYQYDMNPTNVIIKENKWTLKFKLVDFERVEIKSISSSEIIDIIGRMARFPYASQLEKMRFVKAFFFGLSDSELKKKFYQIQERYNAQLKVDADKMVERCTSENRRFGVIAVEGYSGYYRKKFVDDSWKPEELTKMDGDLYEILEVSDPLTEWKKRNREAVLKGKRPPFAVLIKKGARKGHIFLVKRHETTVIKRPAV